MSSIPKHLEEQWKRLITVHPGASLQSLSDGSALVTIPAIALPGGWSRSSTSIDFIVPLGYPAARPDCFFAEADLRLVSGGMPASSGANQLPHSNAPRVWFSWHVSSWQPGRDDLLTYVGVVQSRLNRPE